MNLSQRQLSAFVHVARLASFTRAAEILNITQAGLSAMIRDLEAQFGARLFDRNTRSVSLTPVGRELMPAAIRILEEFHRVEESIGHGNKSKSRRIVVGSTPFLSSNVLPAVSAAFAKAHPGVNLRIREFEREKVYEGVADGSLDVGYGIFFADHPSIECQPIGDCPLAVVYPRNVRISGIPDAPGANIHSMFPGLSLLSLPPDNALQGRIDAALEQLGVRLGDREVFDAIPTLLSMVEIGWGITVLPVVPAAMKRYEVSVHLLGPQAGQLSFARISRRNGMRPPGIATLDTCLAALFRGAAVQPVQ